MKKFCLLIFFIFSFVQFSFLKPLIAQESKDVDSLEQQKSDDLSKEIRGESKVVEEDKVSDQSKTSLSTEDEVVTKEVKESEEESLDKVKLTEDSALVRVGWKQSFIEIVDKAQKINNEIKDVINQLRVIRKDKYNDFYEHIENPLDNLFQKVNFEYGVVFEQFELKKLEAFSEYKKSWDGLKTKTEQLDNLEGESFKILNQLNSKLSEAVQDSIEVRKLSKEMLKVSDQNILTQNLQYLEGSLEKIKKIKEEIESDIIKSFTQNMEQVKSLILTVKNELKLLEQKGKDLGLPIEKVKKVFKKQKRIEAEKLKSEKEKRSYWFDKSVQAIAFILSFVQKIVDFSKNVFDWIVNVFSVVVKETEEAEEKESVDPILKKVQFELRDLKKNVKKLEKEKKEITKKMQDLEEVRQRRINQLKEKLLLAKETVIEKEILSKEIVADLEKYAKPIWRIWVEYLFTKALDLVDFVVNKVKKFLNFIYNILAKEKWEQFVIDVKKRVKELEKKNGKLKKSKVADVLEKKEDEKRSLEDLPEEMGPASGDEVEGSSVPVVEVEDIQG